MFGKSPDKYKVKKEDTGSSKDTYLLLHKLRNIFIT